MYFTVETVTTVGYGDYSFRGEPAWLVVFAVLLMMTGALFVAVFFALVTNMLVSRRIEESLGLQKITALRGHVLVIGLGTVGLRVARQLHDAGRDVVVIEKDERNRHLGQLRALGVPVMIADATLPEVLASARLAAASAVAVLTSDDLANLETGLAVRDQLGPRWPATPVVLRIFDPQLAHSVKETFGFRNVRSTAALAAPWFVGAALGLDVLSTFYAGDEPLLIARLTVTPGGGLEGLRMDELAARTRVLALRRAADRSVLEHPPRRTTRFQPGRRGVPHRPLRRAADGAAPRPALSPACTGRWPARTPASRILASPEEPGSVPGDAGGEAAGLPGVAGRGDRVGRVAVQGLRPVTGEVGAHREGGGGARVGQRQARADHRDAGQAAAAAPVRGFTMCAPRSAVPDVATPQSLASTTRARRPRPQRVGDAHPPRRRGPGTGRRAGGDARPPAHCTSPPPLTRWLAEPAADRMCAARSTAQPFT